MLAAVDGRSSAVSAVVDRPVAIGRYVGTADAPPTLVAVDSHVAGDLLRGRLEDGTWGGVASELDPGPAVTGLALAGDATLQGQTASALPITVTATAVVEGSAGLRHPLTAAPVPLDGGVHPLIWTEPVDGQLRRDRAGAAPGRAAGPDP